MRRTFAALMTILCVVLVTADASYASITSEVTNHSTSSSTCPEQQAAPFNRNPRLVKVMTIKMSDFVDGISINRGVLVGGGNGEPYTIELDANDFITEFVVFTASNGFLNSISGTTNNGRTFGRLGAGVRAEYKAPAGLGLVDFNAAADLLAVNSPRILITSFAPKWESISAAVITAPPRNPSLVSQVTIRMALLVDGISINNGSASIGNTVGGIAYRYTMESGEYIVKAVTYDDGHWLRSIAFITNFCRTLGRHATADFSNRQTFKAPPGHGMLRFQATIGYPWPDSPQPWPNRAVLNTFSPVWGWAGLP